MSVGPIPRGVLDQHIAILGKTRSGKSTVMRGLVEDLLDRQEPVCIVDPKGDWWGLKLACDGKGPGYPVVIFGGPHADVPINEHAGAHVAELFATGNRPCLIDLKGWMPGERTRFWVAFASTLFRLTKGKRWLAIDEIHNFAPKGKILDPDSGKALHWANRLASEGLGMGIAMLFASQRPQKVHNDLLTSAETLIAMRVLHPSDREAITDWIKGCGDTALGAKVLGTLAQMDRGEGWAWSPEIGFGPERVKFPVFRTYDSFRPQTADDAKSLKGWAEVDLEEVRAKLADVVKDAEANDPAKLHKRIRELEALIAKAPAPASDTGLELQLEEAHERMAGMAEETQRVVAENLALREELKIWLDRVAETLKRLGGGRPDFAPATQELLHRSPPPVQSAPPPVHVSAAPVHKAAVPSVRPAAEAGPIQPAKQRILDALAWLAAAAIDPAPRTQIGLLAEQSPTSGTFANYLGALRTAGLIEYPAPGQIALTEAGRGIANHPSERVTSSRLHDRLRTALAPARWRIMEALIAAYPVALERTALAKSAGQSPTSGTYANYLGALRSRGFLDYPAKGQVKAEPVLFIGGRR